MRPATHLLCLGTFAALLLPALEVAATSPQNPGFFKEPGVLQPSPLNVSTPQRVAQADDRKTEAARLHQQGLQQEQIKQFREALQLLLVDLEQYRQMGFRRSEANTLNNRLVAL